MMTIQRMTDNRQGYLIARATLSINPITGNLLTIGLVFVTLIFQETTSMPSSLTIKSTDEVNEFVFPGTEGPWLNSGNEKKNVSHQENDIKSSGYIIFPTENSESRLNVFTPGPTLECREKTYCENTNSYPANYVNDMIAKYDDLEFLASIDEVYSEVDSISHRIDDDTTALCISEERLIYPTSAQNRDNNWLFVLNQENFKQGVRIETCLSSDSECSVISGLIEGYKTMCKQNYILRQLVAITPNGTVIRDSFKLPSSCCCQIKFNDSNNRKGMNLEFQTNNETQS